MGFFDSLRRAAEGIGQDGQYNNDHHCARCQVSMQYRGAHAMRTGGLTRGTGLLTDLFLGGGDEGFLNTAMEKNVAVHVFVCPQCGGSDFVNDPNHGV